MIDQIYKDIREGFDVFLTGGAGVGKTYTVKQLIQRFAADGIVYAVCASTGVAARNLDEKYGTTIHYFLGSQGYCHVSQIKLCRRDGVIRGRIQNTKVLIIDEISMISATQLGLYKEILVRNNFSGSILYVGDFMQLKPIRGRQFPECTNEFAFQSGRFTPKVYELTKNWRNQDEEFNSHLNNLRFGEGLNEALHYLSQFTGKPSEEELQKYTVLYAKNDEVDKHNNKMLDLIEDKPLITYKGVFEGDSAYKSKILESILAQEEFVFKVGARVMLVRNIQPYKNGDIGYIYDYTNNPPQIKVRFEDGSSSVFSPYEFKHYEYDDNYTSKHPVASFSQFPFRIAYGVTVHKSQGLSIDRLYVDACSFFDEGQFYVALSRAKDLRFLCLNNLESDAIQTSQLAKQYYQTLRSKMNPKDDSLTTKQTNSVATLDDTLSEIVHNFISQKDNRTSFVDESTGIEFEVQQKIYAPNGISYVTFLALGNKTSCGIYPAIYNYHRFKKIFVAFGSSKRMPKTDWDFYDLEEDVLTIEEHLSETEVLAVKEWKYNYLDNYALRYFSDSANEIDVICDSISLIFRCFSTSCDRN